MAKKATQATGKNGRARARAEQASLKHLAWLTGITLAIKLLVMLNIPGGAWLGADGENYLGHVELLWKNGLFTEGLMYWPAGYPLLLALLSLPSHGAMLWLLSLVQSLAWAAAVWLLARELLTTRLAQAAVPFAYLAFLNPTLSLASLVVGYESLTAAAHVAALGLMLRDLRAEDEQRPRWPMPTAATFLGLATFMQPRLAVSALLLLGIWWVARGRDRTATVLVAAALCIVMAFPAALVARNHVANGVATISTNLGATMMIGAGPEASGTYTNEAAGVPCEIAATTEADVDSAKVRCVLRWYSANPLEMLRLSWAKTVQFWSPWYGPLAQGTMARNPWLQIHPVRVNVQTQAAADVAFGPVGLIVSWLWVIGGWVLLAAGLAGAWKLPGRERMLGAAAGTVVATSWLISLGTIGDHRFRIPVMGASLLLQVAGWQMLKVRAKSRTLR